MKYFVHCVNALSHFLLLAVFGIKYKVNLLFSLLVHQMASTECHQDERRCFTAFFFFFFFRAVCTDSCILLVATVCQSYMTRQGLCRLQHHELPGPHHKDL